MIPTIGIMVGVYIFTRMISFVTRSGDRREKTVVRIFAVFTMIVAALCTIDLLWSGFSATLGALTDNLPASSAGTAESRSLPSEQTREEPVRGGGMCRFKGDFGKSVCVEMTKRACGLVEGSWKEGQECP
jgi:hypothetical protein